MAGSKGISIRCLRLYRKNKEEDDDSQETTDIDTEDLTDSDEHDGKLMPYQLSQVKVSETECQRILQIQTMTSKGT